MADKQESVGRSVASDPNANRTNGGDSSGTALGQQASQALEGLRSVIEQASQVLRDLTQAGGSMGTKYRPRAGNGAGPAHAG
jgi:hypothetical protein